MRGELIELAPPETGEITVYVKGFLGRGESPERFKHWHASHRELEERLDWGAGALGYRWPAGSLSRWPMPVLTAARSVWGTVGWLRHGRRLSPVSFVGWAAAEELLRRTGSLVVQYAQARRAARERADDLAALLVGLRRDHDRVRVVAHSLGCLHAIEATARLPERERPDELHLCAPACREDEVAEQLEALPRDRAHLYYTGKDAILAAAFRALSLGPALGAAGPKGRYARLEAHDVGGRFDFFVHHRYAERFAEIAAGADGSDEGV